MKRAFSLLLPSLWLLAGLGQAADIPGARWYRYYDDKHQPTVTDSVTAEHISRGYDALSANMQLIQHVPPQRALTPEEIAANKAKRDAEAQRARDDKQLLRLYSTPSDAEHARDRQIDALQLRIDFSSNAVTSLRQRRAADAQKAAVYERTGKPVPKDLKDSISNYDKQIQSAQTEVSERKAEQDRIRKEFEPVITRLKELTGAKPATPAGGTPAP